MTKKSLKETLCVLGYVMTTLLLPIVIILGQEGFETAYPIALLWVLIVVCSSLFGLVYFLTRSNLRMTTVLFERQ